MRINKSRLRRDVKLGVKNLLLHKLRSLLTMLGLVFGVGSVIAMLAIGEGASEEALEQIRKLGSRNIIITAKVPEEEGRNAQNNVRMSIYGLLNEDYRRLAIIPTVVAAVPVKMFQKEASLGRRSQDLRVVGTTDKWFELVEREVVAGRVLTDKDIEDRTSAVVLSEHGARKLLATESAIGAVLRLGGQTYEVVGIVKSELSENASMQTPDQPTDAYIPISTAREHFGDIFSQRRNGANVREQVELHRIIVKVVDDKSVVATSEAIERVLAMFHKKQDYTISVPLALLRQAEATKRTFAIVLGSIAGISLLVGGIGIMNIMLATVTERTREIGIRRAIGARASQIVSQFLIETMVLSITGGLIGILVGVFIPWLVTYLADMPTIVTPVSIFLSLGISVSVGIVFGIYPAIRASRLDPIIALRHE
ncbi:MAG: ABC transporter permease [Kiritimatiellaeota bacterium]|nr:ABC transporter permease [Kiritimatiellota bacterium]